MAKRKFFGPPPKGPLTLPGTYVTPEGGVSAGGPAITKQYRYGGGDTTQPAPAPIIDTTVKPTPDIKKPTLTPEQTERYTQEQTRAFQRERERRGISPGAPFGSTQPERDVLKASRFYEDVGTYPEGTTAGTASFFKSEMGIAPTTTLETPVTKPSPPSKPPIGAIEPYDPFAPSFKTKKELGAERLFLGRVVEGAKGSFRGLFNEQLVGDTTLSDAFTITTDYSQEVAPLMPYQTRGTIVTGQPTRTYGDVYEYEKLAVGGGKPTEFILQDIGEGLQTTYGGKLGTEQKVIQQQIDIGAITLKEGEGLLETKRGEFEKQMQSEFELKGGDIIARRGIAESRKPVSKIDLTTPLYLGAVIGGSLVAPQVTGTLLYIKGAVGFWKGFTEPTTLGKAMGIGGGLLEMGMGLPMASKSIERSIIGEELKTLQEQPVKYTVDRYLGGGKQDLDIIKGLQESRGLKTEFEIIVKVEKTGGGAFYMPTGKGTATTTGQFDWNLLSGKAGTSVSAGQEFIVGAKGFSFEVGESGKMFGTIGKGALEPIQATSAVFKTPTSQMLSPKLERSISKQLVRNLKVGGDVIQEPFAGISLKLKENLYVSRSGRITSAGISPTSERAMINFYAKDVGLTRIIPMKDVKVITTVDIMGGGGGLRANVPTSIQDIATAQQIGATFGGVAGKSVSQQIVKSLGTTGVLKSFGGTGLTTSTKQIPQKKATTYTSQVQELSQGTKFYPRHFQKMDLGMKDLTEVRERGALSPLWAQPTTPKESLGQGLGLVQAPVLELKQKQLSGLKLTPGAGFVPPFVPKIDLPFKGGLGFGGFLLPGFGLIMKQPPLAKGKKGFKYQPSLAALGLDISAPRTGFEFTGIALRAKKPKKKKKRRK